MSVFDYTDESKRAEAIEAAVTAIRAGQLIVLPTDTVYGVGADAFSASAVQALLDAKGRGRDVPPPVLVGDAGVLHALGVDIPPIIEDLVDHYWPGPLTVIVHAQPSLMWDLGDTHGTVALRMPEHDGTLELLKRSGPLAVSSANRHGKDAATTIMDAATQLGDQVEVYLDSGPSTLGMPSTIIDATVQPPTIVRPGAISEDDIVEKFGPIFDEPAPDEPITDEPATDEPATEEPVIADPATGDPTTDDPMTSEPNHHEIEGSTLEDSSSTDNRDVPAAGEHEPVDQEPGDRNAAPAEEPRG